MFHWQFYPTKAKWETKHFIEHLVPPSITKPSSACIYCNKPFKPNYRKNQKYCSRECGYASYNGQQGG